MRETRFECTSHRSTELLRGAELKEEGEVAEGGSATRAKSHATNDVMRTPLPSVHYSPHLLGSRLAANQPRTQANNWRRAPFVIGEKGSRSQNRANARSRGCRNTGTSYGRTATRNLSDSHPQGPPIGATQLGSGPTQGSSAFGHYGPAFRGHGRRDDHYGPAQSTDVPVRNLHGYSRRRINVGINVEKSAPPSRRLVSPGQRALNVSSMVDSRVTTTGGDMQRGATEMEYSQLSQSQYFHPRRSSASSCYSLGIEYPPEPCVLPAYRRCSDGTDGRSNFLRQDTGVRSDEGMRKRHKGSKSSPNEVAPESATICSSTNVSEDGSSFLCYEESPNGRVISLSGGDLHALDVQLPWNAGACNREMQQEHVNDLREGPQARRRSELENPASQRSAVAGEMQQMVESTPKNFVPLEETGDSLCRVFDPAQTARLGQTTAEPEAPMIDQAKFSGNGSLHGLVQPSNADTDVEVISAAVLSGTADWIRRAVAIAAAALEASEKASDVARVAMLQASQAKDAADAADRAQAVLTVDHATCCELELVFGTKEILAALELLNRQLASLTYAHEVLWSMVHKSKSPQSTLPSSPGNSISTAVSLILSTLNFTTGTRKCEELWVAVTKANRCLASTTSRLATHVECVSSQSCYGAQCGLSPRSQSRAEIEHQHRHLNIPIRRAVVARQQDLFGFCERIARAYSNVVAQLKSKQNGNTRSLNSNGTKVRTTSTNFPGPGSLANEDIALVTTKEASKEHRGGHRHRSQLSQQLGFPGSYSERSMRAHRHVCEERMISELLVSSAREARVENGAVTKLPPCFPGAYLNLKDAHAMCKRVITGITYKEEENETNVKGILRHPIVLDFSDTCVMCLQVENPKQAEVDFVQANQWTDLEKLIFLDKFIQYPKNFGRISMFLSRKRARDCVRLYYDSKYDIDYKALLREHQQRRRGKGGCWDVTQRAVRAFGGDLEYDGNRNIVWFRLPLHDHVSTTAPRHPFKRSHPSKHLASHDTEGQHVSLLYAASQQPHSFESHGFESDRLPSVRKQELRSSEVAFAWLSDGPTSSCARCFHGLSSRKCKLQFTPLLGNQGASMVDDSQISHTTLSAGVQAHASNSRVVLAHPYEGPSKRRNRKRTRDCSQDHLCDVVSSDDVATRRRPQGTWARQAPLLPAHAISTRASESIKGGDLSASLRRTLQKWTAAEKESFLHHFTSYGKNWAALTRLIPTKTEAQIKNYYQNYKNRLGLRDILSGRRHIPGVTSHSPSLGHNPHKSRDQYPQKPQIPHPPVSETTNSALTTTSMHHYRACAAVSPCDELVTSVSKHEGELVTDCGVTSTKPSVAKTDSFALKPCTRPMEICGGPAMRASNSEAPPHEMLTHGVTSTWLGTTISDVSPRGPLRSCEDVVHDTPAGSTGSSTRALYPHSKMPDAVDLATIMPNKQLDQLVAASSAICLQTESGMPTRSQFASFSAAATHFKPTSTRTLELGAAEGLEMVNEYDGDSARVNRNPDRIEIVNEYDSYSVCMNKNPDNPDFPCLVLERRNGPNANVGHMTLLSGQRPRDETSEHEFHVHELASPQSGHRPGFDTTGMCNLPEQTKNSPGAHDAGIHICHGATTNTVSSIGMHASIAATL